MLYKRQPSLSFLLNLALLLLSLAGCDENHQPDPTPTCSADWFHVYFTNPKSPTAETYRGGPDEKLTSAIEVARLSVDAAIYDLNLWSLRDALIRAFRRGVAVRLVVESDNLDEPEIRDLVSAGIPILGDRREGLMHNKFVIIDRSEVWTGSMNFTTSDAYLNDNNLLQVRSVRIAENFLIEFDEMFQNDLFGPDIRAATPHPRMTIKGVPVEVYFSPDDKVAEHLLDLLRAAQRSIYFMAFSFTADDLADAILERAQKGVVVAGVMEEAQVKSNSGSDYDRFLQAGLDVRLDSNPRNMHHKVILIDGETVITGSYNFSNRAEKDNDENVVVIHDPAIADQFMVEFERLYQDAHR